MNDKRESSNTMWQDDDLDPSPVAVTYNIPATLEIKIHHTDGFCAHFRQTDPIAIAALLDHLNPDTIFHRPQINLVDDVSLNVIQTGSISWIEVIMEGYPNWHFQPGVDRIDAISEDEYMALATQPDPTSEGQVLFQAVKFDLVNGDHLFHKIVGPQMTMSVDLNMSLKNLFMECKCVVARNPSGGAILLNPANVLRMRVFPRSPNHSGSLPAGVWVAPYIAVESEPALRA